MRKFFSFSALRKENLKKYCAINLQQKVDNIYYYYSISEIVAHLFRIFSERQRKAAA